MRWRSSVYVTTKRASSAMGRRGLTLTARAAASEWWDVLPLLALVVVCLRHAVSSIAAF
jgi:hypothetical protein